jgi:hypothetical protein
MTKRGRDAYLLAAPFAWIGLVGGWITATACFHFSMTQSPSAFLALLCATPLLAGLLGRWLGSLRTARRRVLGFLFGTPVAGAVNGALCGLAAGIRESRDLGSYFLGGGFVGVVYGVFFLPALAPAFCAAFVSDRAREGSVLWRVDRRAPLALAAGVSALAVTTFWIEVGTSGFSRVIAAAALAFALVTLVRDTRDFVEARAEWRRAKPVGAECAATQSLAEAYDLGVGSQVSEVVAPATVAYRDVAKQLAVMVGDATEARSRLGSALWRDVFTVLVAFAVALRP